MYCLLEVVSVCPEKLAPTFVEKIDWIKVSECPLSAGGVPAEGFTGDTTISCLAGSSIVFA